MTLLQAEFAIIAGLSIGIVLVALVAEFVRWRVLA